MYKLITTFKDGKKLICKCEIAETWAQAVGAFGIYALDPDFMEGEIYDRDTWELVLSCQLPDA